MKNLRILFVLGVMLLFSTITVTAQTNYEMSHGVHTVFQMYEDAMTDSVGTTTINLMLVDNISV